MPDHYDYIITGAGCSGLSLLMHVLQTPELNQKRILLLDHSAKTDNDKTWCFWEKDKGIFEKIVFHQWQQVQFYADSWSKSISLYPYTYKMLRSIDFYAFVLDYARLFPNVVFRNEEVIKVCNDSGMAVAVTKKQQYRAHYIFNSILFQRPVPGKKEHFLLQHFTGWEIETDMPHFNPELATFMDFRVNQQHGTTFMYVLPVSANRALVEYTLFTENLLNKEAYEIALHDYISHQLKINSYRITHAETGIIPMTNIAFKKGEGRIIHLGTAGGDTKPSSGYTFKFIQDRVSLIVKALVKGEDPLIHPTLKQKKFLFYDSVLLHVLRNRTLGGAEVFAAIFSGNPVERVLRFLDNESTFTEDIQVMNSVPKLIFMKAALREMIL